MIRSGVSEWLARLREVIAAAGLGVSGLWLCRLGGNILIPIGLLMIAIASGWGLTAWRWRRFQTDVAAPGLVEVLEGQISYMGPEFGSYVSIPELIEIRMLVLYGRRHWRLKQEDGQALLIPVDAAGAGALFDAFSGLDGIDMGRVLAAQHGRGAEFSGGGETDGARVSPAVWRRHSGDF